MAPTPFSGREGEGRSVPDGVDLSAGKACGSRWCPLIVRPVSAWWERQGGAKRTVSQEAEKRLSDGLTSFSCSEGG